MTDLPIDPLDFARTLWPHLDFYDEQEEAIRSVQANEETIVVAAHQVGKDFLSGFIALYFFLTRHPVRIVTTSIRDDHLRVLWGEIGRFIQESKYPLLHKEGGPLIANHREVRKVHAGKPCTISYLIGTVSEKGEGMQGHHAAHTLLIADEASGIDDMVYERADTWAKRKLIIGNPYACQNFFRRGVKEGDRRSATGSHLRRKVIKVTAEASPNVKLALIQQRKGRPVTGEVVVPGVLTWAEYQERRSTWDAVRQCVGLDAEFYEGAEILLFPPSWLNAAASVAERIRGQHKAEAIGVDPGEGVAMTTMYAISRHGVVEGVAKKTPDTDVIPREVLAFMHRHGVPAEKVAFDAGGGGKQAADRLRAMGHPVQTVAFGEAVTPRPRRGMTRIEEKIEQREERYVFCNRRSQMYGEFSEALDPSLNPQGFGIPAEYSELRRQLAPIPKTYDPEGRLKLPPKNKRSAESKERTLTEMIGRSPDDSDAVVLAYHVLTHVVRRAVAGAM